MNQTIEKKIMPHALLTQLTETELKLLHEAANVRKNAQAPYSNFHVGAAVLTNNGTIYSGCNVERCTLTQTTHAEQNAIDTMIAAEGSAKIEAVAFIAAPATQDVTLPKTSNITISNDQTGAPCGHCLQIIWENCYGDANVKVMTLLAHNQIYVSIIGQLLPVRFGPQDLGIEYTRKT